MAAEKTFDISTITKLVQSAVDASFAKQTAADLKASKKSQKSTSKEEKNDKKKNDDLIKSLSDKIKAISTNAPIIADKAKEERKKELLKDDKFKNDSVKLDAQLKKEGYSPDNVNYVRFTKEGLSELMSALVSYGIGTNEAAKKAAASKHSQFDKGTTQKKSGGDFMSTVLSLIGAAIAGWTVIDAIKSGGGLAPFLAKLKVVGTEIWGMLIKHLVAPVWNYIAGVFGLDKMTDEGDFIQSNGTTLGPWAEIKKGVGLVYDKLKSKFGKQVNNIIKSITGSEYFDEILAVVGTAASAIMPFLPVIGTMILAGKAYYEFKSGKNLKGAMTLAQAAVSLVPGIGPVIGIGIGLIDGMLSSKWAKENLLSPLSGDGFFGGILSILIPLMKPLLKKIPFISTIMYGAEAIINFKSGNIVTGFWNIAAAIAGFIPGIGTAIQIGMGVVEMLFNTRIPVLGFSITDVWTEMQNNISSWIANNIYNIPILSNLMFASDAISAFSSGNLYEGFKNIACAMVSLIPGGGTMLSNALGFFETIFNEIVQTPEVKSSGNWIEKIMNFGAELEKKVLGWILPDDDDGWFGAAGYIKGLMGIKTSGKKAVQPVNKTIDNTTKNINKAIEDHANNIQTNLNKDSAAINKASSEKNKKQIEITKKANEENAKINNINAAKENKTVQAVDEMHDSMQQHNEKMLATASAAAKISSQSDAAIISKLDELINTMRDSRGSNVMNSSSTNINMVTSSFKPRIRERLA